jgi:hypothetical protein
MYKNVAVNLKNTFVAAKNFQCFDENLKNISTGK